ncbi:MAG TPA: hypothetical protein VNK67_02500 [Burkholderiales bacterium]|nr:hypothetical protein [Burkholderiales bacterium]
MRGYEIKDSGYLGRPSGIQQDIYWLDNNRVIFIGAKPGDVVEPIAGVKQIRYGLFVWDLSAGTVKRHHEADIANGNLCVFRGYIRLSYTSDHRLSPVAQRWYVFEGPFGKEKLRLVGEQEREESRQYERVLNSYTCREYRRSELPALGYRVEPLLEGEFISREREPIGTEMVHWAYWPRNGSPVLLNMTPEAIGIERYSEYLDSYVLHEYPRGVVFSDTVIRRWWLMDRNGGIRDFTPPTGPWMRGSTFVMPTKRGLLLVSHAIRGGGNGAAGAYLQDRKGLFRIIDGLPESFDISPDGCRTALAISQWSRDKPVTPWVKAVNLCTKGG